jgi:hypothetical protein
LPIRLLQSTFHSHLQYLSSSHNTYTFYDLLFGSDLILLRCVLACINHCSPSSTVSQPRPFSVLPLFSRLRSDHWIISGGIVLWRTAGLRVLQWDSDSRLSYQSGLGVSHDLFFSVSRR